MRLLKCHIENFGKLQDFDLEFGENPMVINKPNGWGKSTLAAFIKVMFYGFANEKKRGDGLERERVRFRPWQGGVYGGEITFEAGGKRYLLNRTFGAKEADDTFSLYDADTNLKSEDFSRSIGEELFQINRESFLRTIYIAQNDCVTGTTDSINAKVGNLADNLDDINNYEKVQLMLKDLRNSMSPGRKTGELKKLKNEIDELKNEIRRKDSIEKAIAELESRLSGCVEEKEAAQREQAALQEELVLLSRHREIAAKKAHYEKILGQCRERQAVVNACESVLGGRVPDPRRMQDAMAQKNAMMQQEAALRANALTQEERTEYAALREKFRGGVPEEKLIIRGRELAEQWESLREEAARYRFSYEEEQEFARLEAIFGGTGAEEEDIDLRLHQWNQCCDTGNRHMFLFPLCLVPVGAALFFLIPWAGIAFAAAGLALAVFLRAVHISEKRKLERGVLHFLEIFGSGPFSEKKGVRDALYVLKGDIRAYGRFQERQRDCESMGYERKLSSLREELADMLNPFFDGREIGERNPQELFADLENDRERYSMLAAREERSACAQAERGRTAAALESFLEECGQKDVRDLDEGLRYIAQKSAEYESDMEELEKSRKERQEFEKTYDIGNFEELVSAKMREPEEVRAGLLAVSERLEAVSDSRNFYLAQMDERQQELEELELMEERLSELTERYEQGYQNYRCLELTGEYLARAKESFSARYMGPILSAFRRNYEMICRISGQDFRIDANVRITKHEMGEQRDEQSFSAGNRDLIGIALRMALIDAMYRKEQPFLIFDDSFVNLDDEKTACAGEFLRSIAEKYQVIYFTCHGSRSLTG